MTKAASVSSCLLEMDVYEEGKKSSAFLGSMRFHSMLLLPRCLHLCEERRIPTHRREEGRRRERWEKLDYKSLRPRTVFHSSGALEF